MNDGPDSPILDTSTAPAATPQTETEGAQLPDCFGSLVASGMINQQIADALAQVDPTYRSVTLRTSRSAVGITKPLAHLFPDFLTGCAAELGACGLVRATVEPHDRTELPVNFVFMLTPELIKALLPQQTAQAVDPLGALASADLSKLDKGTAALLPLLATMMEQQKQTSAMLRHLEQSFIAPWVERSQRFEEMMAKATLRKLEHWIEEADAKPVTMAQSMTLATDTLKQTFAAVGEATKAMRELTPEDKPLTPKDLIAMATSPQARRAVAAGLRMLGAKVPVDPTMPAQPEHYESADVPAEPGQTKTVFSTPAVRTA